MQNDLISRKALIKHLKDCKEICGMPLTKYDEQVIEFVIGHIENAEPTAYNVEKVVAELERNRNRGVADFQSLLHLGRYRAYNDAIYIVRNGGRG